MTAWFAFIRHSQVVEALALGWVWERDLGPTHGQWSCLMRWPCQIDPVMPGFNSTVLS